MFSLTLLGVGAKYLNRHSVMEAEKSRVEGPHLAGVPGWYRVWGGGGGGMGREGLRVQSFFLFLYKPPIPLPG